ncbi:tRNA pseudouridine(55) synthase TruB [Ectobacillus ponti]|uniref:tRNA pseudouridine synthase B n=1 Tax=Ectobacillus ponti TaxID=2961894 RepID=A0AA42BR20_9BACI|nr:tRNA pseudouridine(55) synthase TruB [Ectobacillus ponti]MCP8969039.1 tRNA pseudouridine(55) synthase TruB [Ectobacillus ponti]
MDGVLLLNKPKGMTSHDCVFKARKILREKRIGHTGTLDPDVTGVLPLCIGRATKIAQFLTSETKIYEGEVTIGFSTTTEDASGEIVEQKEVSRTFSRADILDVLSSLTGTLQQMPPMYSAVKVNGRKLYEYARQGIEVERPVRTITIHQFELLDDREAFTGSPLSFRFRVACSKGTYVRTLAVMIGERLGYPAHMSDLTRTASGMFTLAQCVTLAELEERAEQQSVQNILLPIEQALAEFPRIDVDAEQADKVKNGAFLPNHDKIETYCTVFDPHGVCLAIYEPHPAKQGLLKPLKVLVNDQELQL